MSLFPYSHVTRYTQVSFHVSVFPYSHATRYTQVSFHVSIPLFPCHQIYPGLISCVCIHSPIPMSPDIPRSHFMSLFPYSHATRYTQVSFHVSNSPIPMSPDLPRSHADIGINSLGPQLPAFSSAHSRCLCVPGPHFQVHLYVHVHVASLTQRR